jgi:hypothetical protein
VPLYRLSYQGTHGSNTLNVDHTYTTEQAGIDAYQADYYQLDGIEGYIYPCDEVPQPSGTVQLYRKYNPTRDDHAIFPETMLSVMTDLGYTENKGSAATLPITSALMVVFLRRDDGHRRSCASLRSRH